MLTTNDFINIFLPVLSHWIVWLSFVIVVIIILVIYAYPYLKKSRKEFLNYHIRIPIVCIIALYIFTKMLEGVIYNGSILNVDSWINGVMTALKSQWLIKTASIITNLGGGISIYLLFIFAIGILLFKKRWRFALLSTVVFLSGALLEVSVKYLVHRTRPENLIASGYSFPSGHAIMAIVFASLLIYSFKDDFKNKVVKYVLIIAALSFFIAVAISRIILHVHWFSDVVAGMSLGLFWFMFVVLVERSITGVIKAVRIETKMAEPIVPREYYLI